MESHTSCSPHPPTPQVATKLYTLPLFRPAWAPLAEALLAMLLSRLYTAAQDDLSDSLFALAAANWTEFLLVGARLLSAVGAHLLSCVAGWDGSGAWPTWICALAATNWTEPLLVCCPGSCGVPGVPQLAPSPVVPALPSMTLLANVKGVSL